MLDMNDIDGLSPQSYRNTLLRETGPESSQYTSTPMSKLGGWGKAAGRKLHVGKTKGITPIKYIAKVMSMPEDELEEFQRDLYAAGFYGSVVGQKDEEPLWGAPDLPTKQAVRALAEMTMTFKGRLSIVEVLDRFRKAADKDNDGKPDEDEEEKQKPVVTLTSKVDLAAQAQDAAVDLMGRRLDEGQVGGAIGGYNAIESAYQVGSQTAQFENTGGTFTAPASPGAYAEQQLRQQHGAEVDSYSYLKNVNHLLAMVGLD
jgi:hypothetical protein